MLRSKKIANLLDQLSFWKKDFYIKYLGFNVYYNLGNSLISRIRFGKMYEPEVSNVIFRYLSNIDKPIILDIGANIGLMSLNILYKCPNSKIFAFEPGPVQFNIFKKTIECNKIENIILSNFALSNSIGTSNFVIHSGMNCAGDGLKDTGRAGQGEVIEVQTTTLDEWWKQNDKIIIDLIKIDTEGAELIVFEGAKNFFEKCKPVVIFEMHKVNLSAFNYGANDILTFLNEIGYEISSFHGEIIDFDNLVQLMEKYEEFIAIPK